MSGDVSSSIFLEKDAVNQGAKSYCDVICEFIRENNNWTSRDPYKLSYDNSGSTGGSWLPDKSAESVLNYIANTLAQQGQLPSPDHVYVKWIPSCNCALVAFRGQGCMPAPVRYLSLIALDHYEFCQRKSTTTNFTPLSHGYASVHVTQIPEDKFAEFIGSLQQTNSSQLSNPGLVEKWLKHAWENLGRKPQPKFYPHQYNVSTSTGWPNCGYALNANWHLVLAVTEILMTSSHSAIHVEHPNSLFHLFHAHFELWLIERGLRAAVAPFQNKSPSRQNIVASVDRVMQRLSSATRKAGTLAEKGFALTIFTSRATRIRHYFDHLMNEYGRNIASKYMVSAKMENISSPELNNIAEETLAQQMNNQADLSKEAKGNLDIIPLLLTTNPDMKTLYDWMNSLSGTQTNHLIVARKTVESVMFELSKTLLGPSLDVDVAHLEEVIDLYRLRNQQYIKLKGGTVELRSEATSNEILVVWIAFCLNHKDTKVQRPLIASYGVALDWKDMGYLVLSSRDAVAASLQVSKYVKKNTTNAPLFSLKNQAPTIDMADKFFASDLNLRQIWSHEVNATGPRIEEHWKKVVEKQALVQKIEKELEENRQAKIELQREINYRGVDEEWDKIADKQNEVRDLEREIQRKQRKTSYLNDEIGHNKRDPNWIHDNETLEKIRSLDKEKSENEAERRVLESKLRSLRSIVSNKEVEYRNKTHNLNNRLNQLTNQISRNEKDLKAARTPPPALFQPLPKSPLLGGRYLFFLHIPLDIQRYARCAISAQQMLLPKEKWPKIEGSTMSLQAYYNNHRPYQKSPHAKIHAVSFGQVPEKVGPRDVMDYHEKEQGVWYPDSLTLYMAWNGGNFTLDSLSNFFNPFEEMPAKMIIDYLTEEIKEKSNQWIVPQYGSLTSKSRGNETIANQYLKPDWCSKNEWMELANLRSYPNRQLQNLCRALSDRVLSLQQPLVQTLVQMLLYQTGELEEDESIADQGEIYPQWKHDLLFGEFCKNMRSELLEYAEELRNKPRDYRSMFVLILIMNYISQYDVTCIDIRKTFIEILKTWSKDAETQIETVTADLKVELRLKRTLYSKYQLLCYSQGPIEEEHAAEMCKLIVKTQNEINLEKKNDIVDEINSIEPLCQALMRNRMPDLLRECDKSGCSMLTKAVKAMIPDTPDSLLWDGVVYNDSTPAYDNCCFQAESPDHQLYSINLFNGIVLVNGKPIARMPASICNHALYKRIFGEKKFDICLIKGTYTTVEPIGGCVYRFQLRSERLIIREFDIKSRVELQLMDINECKWAEQLPLRLKQLHSHWYCKEKKMVLFRNINFSKRNFDYVLKEDKDDHWYCYEIPSHRRELAWNEFLRGDLECTHLDRLIVHNELLRQFEKLEDPRYIHLYQHGATSVKIVLPRYKLQFLMNKSEDNGSVVESFDYAGYHLAPCQQLDNTLIGFTKYLILQHKSRGPSDMKLIMPNGLVVSLNGQIDIVVDTNSDAKLSVFTYNVHSRFQTLEGSDNSAIFQLAELYAATSSLLPDIRLKMTGDQFALSLLRQCWSNQPLSDSDLQRLNNIRHFCRHTPALDILTYETICSSRQMWFLHQKSQTEEDVKYPESSAYKYFQDAFPWNMQNSLTEQEELRVLGRKRVLPMSSIVFSSNGSQIFKSEIEGYEESQRRLESLLVKEEKFEEEFLFDDTKSNIRLRDEIMEDLKDSYESYGKIPNIHIKTEEESLEEFISGELTAVKRNRESLEKYLFKEVPRSTDSRYKTDAWQVRRIANIVPDLKLSDLLVAACSPNHLKIFNPYLSEEDLQTLLNEILKWMALCVHEDKLERLNYLSQDVEANHLMIVKEIQAQRKWSPKQYPEWLVFEVMQQLQIRSIQYSVAKTLIEGLEKNQCPTLQLNMGEGKTRVIIPMLILYLRKSASIIRLNFLSALIQEAFSYLQRNMCPGVINCKLFAFPFSRDVHLTKDQATTMLQNVRFCMESGGALLVTPQHRQSLLLKRYEVERSGELEIRDILIQIENLPYIDVLDECDEISRAKTKLIYACGSHEQLLSGEIRWYVAQALLKVIKEDVEVQRILNIPGVSQQKDGCNKSAEAFTEFRLIDSEQFHNLKNKLYEEVVRFLIKNPPYPLRWVNQLEPVILETIKQATQPDAEIPAYDQSFDKSLYDFVLALRGFLANNLLVHCFMKRNRVDYGIKHGDKKRMAVPFHACEMPALRAEFGHPDCAIMYTILSYYYDGLTEKQVIQAFTTLLSLGDSARDAIYKEWYELSKSILKYKSSDFHLNRVAKIDLTNKMQVRSLFECFRYNIGAINFWLNTSVFPIETLQYEHRLEATAWDIATNRNNKVLGFSGTNDEKILMPSTLNWTSVDEEIELKATDGKMLQLILKNACFYNVQNNSGNEELLENRQWVNVLSIIIKMAHETSTIRALIDSGALMAGASSTEDIAMYLAQRLDPALYKGVVYFDQGWKVINHLGQKWMKHSSPVHERECFVYYDESRCRGADMKLSSDAKAVLTLGPKMCKDKLMQAAGRLRQLEHGQRIKIMALDDVITNIRKINKLDAASEITTNHVLSWTLDNTFQSACKWLPEWAVQGGRYVIKQDRSNLALIPDMLNLHEMYGYKQTETLVKEIWNNSRDFLVKARKGQAIPLHLNAVMKGVDDRIIKYGSDYSSILTSFGEECERELEKEVEVEQEVEKQVPQQKARAEQDWDINQLVTPGCNPNTLKVDSQTIRSFVQEYIYHEGKSLKQWNCVINWPEKVHGTWNFFAACQFDGQEKVSLNEYLRLVNACLIFPSGDVLLISEREADRILLLSWKRPIKCMLVNLTYLRQFHLSNSIRFMSPKTDISETTVDQSGIGALQLFNGQVNYDEEARTLAVKDIVNTPFARKVASNFSSFRGLAYMYSRSELEDICTGYI